MINKTPMSNPDVSEEALLSRMYNAANDGDIREKGQYASKAMLRIALRSVRDRLKAEGLREGEAKAADRLSSVLKENERLREALRTIRRENRSVTVGGEWGDWRRDGKLAADALQEEYEPRAALDPIKPDEKEKQRLFESGSS